MDAGEPDQTPFAAVTAQTSKIQRVRGMLNHHRDVFANLVA